MKLKRFIAPNPLQAMKEIKATFGDDAVIVSSRSINNGVEIVAAIDRDAVSLLTKSPENSVENSSRTATKSNLSVLNTEASDEIKEEIRYLRELVETQVSSLTWQKEHFQHPMHMVLLRRLLQLGFSLPFSHKLISGLTEVNLPKAWHAILAKILKSIRFHSDIINTEGGIYALVGPTGVGKTTSLAKIAAEFCFAHGPEQLGLIATDSYRIAAVDQLVTYGKILGVNVAVAQDEKSFDLALHKLQDKKLVLIDTSGLNPKDDKVATQCDFLKKTCYPISVILTLSATHHESVQRVVLDAFSTYAPIGCIITKLDEGMTTGGLLSNVITRKLPLMYLTDGQRVPEDICLASKTTILDLLIEKYSVFGEQVASSDIEMSLSHTMRSFINASEDIA